MKQKIVCILLVLIGLSSYTATAQIKFKKGYIITKDGEKINCFIKDREWLNEPTTYTYKKAKDGTAFTIDTNNIQELKIANRVFIRKLVDIDIPANGSFNLRSRKNTKKVSKELLLERIIDGDLQLFLYDRNSFKKFFIQKNNSEIIQLNYKKYVDDDDKIKEDNLFRKQLWDNFKCEGDKISNFSRTKYSRKALVSIIKKYASCANLNISVSKKEKVNFKEFINVSPKIGFNSTNLTMFPESNLSKAYESKVNNFGPSFGAEVEFLLPLLNRKIAIVASLLHRGAVDITYNHVNPNPPYSGDVNITYDSFLNTSVGFRYYFYLNDDSQIFSSLHLSVDEINGNFNYNSNQNSLRYTNVDLDVNNQYLTFGVGYKYKKYFVEVLYSHSSKDGLRNSEDLLPQLSTWSFNRNVLSINFGYNIF
jgi:hypothetical protein